MGDRISVSFKFDNVESPVLFSHWGGQGFLKWVKAYVETLKREAKEKGSVYPLYRLEPQTVIVDLIRAIAEGRALNQRIESNFYLGKSPNDGDNSDNGHYCFDLKTGKVKHVPYVW